MINIRLSSHVNHLEAQARIDKFIQQLSNQENEEKEHHLNLNNLGLVEVPRVRHMSFLPLSLDLKKSFFTNVA